MKYVEKRLTTPDKAQLLSWLLPTTSSKPLKKTLIIAYAATGNMANCVYYANEFLKAGFDVVLFDYRGFGHSSTFEIDPERFYYNEFVTDFQTAIKAAKTQFPTNQVGVLSFSLSTLLATLAYQKEPFDFMIGEGYVSDPIAITSYWKRVANREFTLPSGVEVYPNATRKLKCPLLLLAGTKDEITPLSTSQAVVAQRPNRSLLTYEGDHLQGTTVWKEREFADGYVRRIKEFAEKI
ncbi:alpha/beta hydrolase family protein [Spirosoma pollinicola]|uniref:alpha/beta hydrolase family protein n=1 Tax=Spirosoma pollinicola TaxID=2057025 RepID=UPI0012FDD639|nr:alpha/beta fold hydrolase [Spirosoma pollinicola]